MTKQNKPMTVYLAHGISDKANFHDSLRIAQEIESIKTTDGLQKFEAYAPAGIRRLMIKVITQHQLIFMMKIWSV